MPMTSRKGPGPAGRVIVELSVIDAPFWFTTTVSVLPDQLAVRPFGGAPLGPDPQELDQRTDFGASAPPLTTPRHARAIKQQEGIVQIGGARERVECWLCGRRRTVRRCPRGRRRAEAGRWFPAVDPAESRQASAWRRFRPGHPREACCPRPEDSILRGSTGDCSGLPHPCPCPPGYLYRADRPSRRRWSPGRRRPLRGSRAVP